MVMDNNDTYCGDHFAVYTNIDSCYSPETNVMSYITYSLMKKNGLEKGILIVQHCENLMFHQVIILT